MVLNAEDEVAKMAVARAAGRIVRADTQQQHKLQNVPRRGEKHNFAAELATDVRDTNKSLAALPRTSVAVHQNQTGLLLYPEVVSCN